MDKKVPPGQVLTKVFPVLSASDVPEIDLAKFRFRVFGKVENPYTLTWDELMEMPKIKRIEDIHCVTHWSRLGDEWEGISLKAVLEKAKPKGKFVMEYASSVGYSTNVPIEYAMDDGAMLAFNFNGKPLEPKHGGPLRGLIPNLYFWKSAKWIDGIEVMENDRPGFWEKRGYNMHGDPWKQERYWDIGESVSTTLKRILNVRQHKGKEKADESQNSQ
ncbi:MAG: sulfite oxidase-like oxidoreductase [Candidatus Micrarchaeaceae archaeon]|jgi:DMSO/TMAO reductase YedYZ molybdopterin-dependent catalytic subunit